ncbi:MAG: hypothetical protein ACRCSP_07305 [Rhodoglobus sp.]
MKTIHLRPHSHVLSHGLTACIAFMVPVFLVLYFLTVPRGPWLAVLVAQLIVTAMIGFATSRYFGVGIWVDENGIAERGFFRAKRHYPLAEIGSVVTATTFESAQLSSQPQLFVCDHEGRQLVRMRGQFWSRASMEKVANALDVPHIPVDETLSTKEIHQDFPDLGYWFERHPVKAALLFALSIGLAGVVIFLAFRLTGIPFGD